MRFIKIVDRGRLRCSGFMRIMVRRWGFCMRRVSRGFSLCSCSRVFGEFRVGLVRMGGGRGREFLSWGIGDYSFFFGMGVLNLDIV